MLQLPLCWRKDIFAPSIFFPNGTRLHTLLALLLLAKAFCYFFILSRWYFCYKDDQKERFSLCFMLRSHTLSCTLCVVVCCIDDCTRLCSYAAAFLFFSRSQNRGTKILFPLARTQFFLPREYLLCATMRCVHLYRMLVAMVFVFEG